MLRSKAQLVEYKFSSIIIHCQQVPIHHMYIQAKVMEGVVKTNTLMMEGTNRPYSHIMYEPYTIYQVLSRE